MFLELNIKPRCQGIFKHFTFSYISFDHVFLTLKQIECHENKKESVIIDNWHSSYIGFVKAVACGFTFMLYCGKSQKKDETCC